MNVYPSSQGTPSIGAYIPQVFAARLLVAFYAATVFGAIANTDYTGDIKNQGDIVTIRKLPGFVVNKYVKGQKLTYQQPEPGSVDLRIDQGLYCNIAFNDVDRLQSDLAFQQEWAQAGAEQMKIEIDSDILANIYGDVAAENAGGTAGLKSNSVNLGVSGTPLAIDSDNILQTMFKCNQVLNEQNVPTTGRYMVLPAWACTNLRLSELLNKSITGQESTISNGRLGQIAGFTVYESNLLTTVTDTTQCTSAIFGQKSALTFASQLVKTETLRNPDDFGDLMRSLHVYGYKVVKPEALGHLYITPASEA